MRDASRQVVSLGVLCLVAGRLAAGTIHVPADHRTIQQAIAAAAPGDTIRVAPGSYHETLDLLGKQLVIESEGGAAVTTIDADGAGSVVTCKSGEPAGTVVAGFTLTDGSGQLVPGAGTTRGGGGAFVGSGSHLRLFACIVTENTVTSTGSAYGGGVYVKGGDVLVSACILSANGARTTGAALYADAAAGTSAALTSCSIVSNVINNAFPGAAVAGQVGAIESCHFEGNDNYGLSHDTGFGVTDCSFVGNLDTGMVVQSDGAGKQVERCLFSGNGLHGLMLNTSMSAQEDTVRDCIFVNNDLQSFGSPFLGTAQVLVENCSFDTGKLILFTFTSGEIDVVNTILRDTLISVAPEHATFTHCNVSGGWSGAGTGNIDADPLWVDPASLDYRLVPGSPCINTGSPGSPLDPDGSPSDMGALPYDPWTELGGAVAGTAGAPTLTGSGPLIAGEPTTLTLQGAAPLQATVLFLGLGALGAPFKGGTLWPTPDLLVPGLLTDGDGGWSLGAAWPAGLPSAFSIWLQVWFPDAGAPEGFAGSNGLRGTTP